MTLPLFPPEDSPGPNFTELLRKLGHAPLDPKAMPSTTNYVDVHATTICALRYADGVIMAGDRRATAGTRIAQRAVEKGHPADRVSGIAIAGAAGFRVGLVRPFPLPLAHYEEGELPPLSFEAK